MNKILKLLMFLLACKAFTGLYAMEQEQSKEMDCSSIQDYITQGRACMHDHLDYNAALANFLHAQSLFDNKAPSSLVAEEKPLAVQAYIGVAFANHNLSKHQECDTALEKARILLKIPKDLKRFSTEDPKYFFSDPTVDKYSIDYCVVAGYKRFVDFEVAKKSHKPLGEQIEILENAEKFFAYAMSVAEELQHETIEKAHAYQGLGTISEFLAKCSQEQDLTDNFSIGFRFAQSRESFKAALTLRVQLLGEKHIQVARSYHKYARALVFYSSVLRKELEKIEEAEQAWHLKEITETTNKAMVNYQQALAIFEHNKIPKEHVKYKELLEEYEAFSTSSKNN